MIKFKILKTSKKSKARLGYLKTPHGIVQTPALVPVATQGVIKTLTSEETAETNSQLLISNTFHLHLKPGEKVVSSNGGLHKFMNWKKPLMTDSGGYQVFSMGFGRDFDISKILKKKRELEVKAGQRPKYVKITPNGVFFSSPVDGSRLFLGPKESIKIQEQLGADIIFAFDECPPPIADYQYTKDSLETTHRWAKACIKSKKSKQAIYGIVQGGKFRDLRIASAKFISLLPFDGFGIGGELGFDKKEMYQMLDWVTDVLPSEKPRHLLGTGHLEDLEEIFKRGVDTVDCVVPTQYARHGVAFTSAGRIEITKTKFLSDKKPLDPKCFCQVCRNYNRSYICHLFRAKEITPLRLVTFHNLFFFNSYVEKIRDKIKLGKL